MAGITADQQYFSPVTSVSESFGKDPEDGILGMAFQTISELNEPPWFQNVSRLDPQPSGQPID
jgi:cathepsin D